MSAWSVVYTEQAENDLRGIYEYIAFSLPAVRKRTLAGMGLRVLQVDNYLVFYLAIEDHRTVAIIRIMYGRRNIEKQLCKGTNS
jgi:toxin ParE1/3/4